MIKSIKVNNFKSLKDISCDFRKFNILCGTNASGKSSLIQSLLLLAQNNSSERIYLNGNLVRLGDFGEVKNSKVGISTPIKIYVENEEGKKFGVEFNADGKNGAIREFLLEFGQDIYYLSANRVGALDIYEESFDEHNFGINGEFCISFLRNMSNEPAPNNIIFEPNNGTAHVFIDEVNYWMKKIVGSEIVVADIEKTNKVLSLFKDDANNKVRPSNTGSGLSYLASIIILCLGVGMLHASNKNKPLVIIENPEIHLHPRAQSKVTEFLSFISQNCAQLIVETHSDHVFNAVRVNLSTDKMKPDEVSIKFFKCNESDTKIAEIEIGRFGKILNHEPDLFEQFDIDIDKMLGIK